jgi:hypothetical protein
MISTSAISTMSYGRAAALVGFFALATYFSPAIPAQDRDRDRDGDRGRVARLEPGTVIPVRTNEFIDSDKGDNRIYHGIVDQDVRGENGRIVVPRGANVELIVRIAADNDLTLDLDSVVVNGQRYGIRTEPKRVDAHRDNSVIGGIVGAISGGEARGRAVRIPKDTIVTFRLARPLEMGAPDHGYDRDGQHYHGDDQRDRDR